jgi:hypothetical protein
MKVSIIENWHQIAKMFLEVRFVEETGKWETVHQHEKHILYKLKLAANFKFNQPDPPNAYDLLLREAGINGLGLETTSEEE